MVHTTSIVAAAAAVATVFILLGAAPAEAQLVHYCGLDFARAVFKQCAMAKRSNPPLGGGNPSSSGARFSAHNTGLEQADDTHIGWYNIARQEAERLHPSLTDIIFSSRFRRSASRGDVTVGQLCCVYGCTSSQLASVC